MSDPRLYILIGQFTAVSYGRAASLLRATLHTSELTKRWFYRERRGYVLLTALLTGCAQVWAVFDAWLMFPVALLLSFKLVRQCNQAIIAKGVILSYREMFTYGVKNYGTEKANVTPIVRGGSSARARRDARRDATGSSRSGAD